MRVIAGSLGGRRLVAPRGAATRPTSDRVREALFSVLGDLRYLRVLDLYAGTGALGIEALSRGAAKAVFVENARPALDALRTNLAALGVEAKAQVVSSRVERALATLARDPPFDLVFIDPPYADAAGALSTADRLLVRPASGVSRVVLEHASKDRPRVPPGLHLLSTRTYGDTALAFFEMSAGSAVGGGEGAADTPSGR
jgi:16S rRNA (guanine966-N2)-methyltransferase